MTDAEVVERAADLVTAPVVRDLPAVGQVLGAGEVTGEIPVAQAAIALAETSKTTVGVEGLPAAGEAEPAAKQTTPLASGDETPAKVVQKPASRNRRPRKPKEEAPEAV